jgi:fumarylacetoacetase
MNPGDLLGTGTISGTEKGSFGCLLEITWGGKNPLKFGEETRVFLQDGDVVTMRGTTGKGVGFGECTGRVLPALPIEEYI